MFIDCSASICFDTIRGGNDRVYADFASVEDDTKQVQSALCTRMRIVFFFDPTWAQDVCV